MAKRKRRKKSGPVVIILLFAIALTVLAGYRISRLNLISFVVSRVTSMLPVKVDIKSSGSTPLGGMYFTGIKVCDTEGKPVAVIDRAEINNNLKSLIALYLSKEGTVTISADGVRVDATRESIEEIVSILGQSVSEENKDDSEAKNTDLALYFSVSVTDIEAQYTDSGISLSLCGGQAEVNTKGELSVDFEADNLAASYDGIEAEALHVKGEYRDGESSSVKIKSLKLEKDSADIGLSEISLSGTPGDIVRGTAEIGNAVFSSGEVSVQLSDSKLEASYDGKDVAAGIKKGELSCSLGENHIGCSAVSGTVSYTEKLSADIILEELEFRTENGEFLLGNCSLEADSPRDGTIVADLFCDRTDFAVHGSFDGENLEASVSTGEIRFSDFEFIVPLFGSSAFSSDITVFSIGADIACDIKDNTGTVSFDVSAKQINLLGTGIDASAGCLLSFDGKNAVLDRFRVSAAGYYADISGKADLENMFADLLLTVKQENHDDTVFRASLSRQERGYYSYQLLSERLAGFGINGVFTPSDEENVYILDALCEYSSGIYPILWSIEKGENGFSAYSSGLYIDISLGSEPSAYLTMRGFPLPDFDGRLGGTVSGVVDVGFGEKGTLEVNAWDLAWDDEGYGFSLSGNFSGLNGLEISNFRFTNADMKPIVGNAEVRLSQPGDWNINTMSIRAVFNSETGEHMYISLIPDGSLLDFLVDINVFDARRLRYPQLPFEMLDINAYGRTDFRKKLDFSFEAQLGLNGKEYGITGLYNDGRLELNNLEIEGIFSDTLLRADIFNGSVEFSTKASVESRHVDRSAKITTDIVLKARTSKTFRDLNLSDIFSTISDTSVEGTLSIENLNADNRFFVDYLPVSVKIDRFRNIELSGEEINAVLNLDDGLTFTADIAGNILPFAFRGNGSVKNGWADVKADHMRVPFEALNIILLKPILTFGDCDITGSGRMVGPLSNPEFFGNVGAADLSLSVFWVPDQEITVKNLYVTVYGDTASIASTPFWVVNKNDGQLTQGFVAGECTITKMSIPDWYLSVSLPSNSVSAFIPIPGAKISINTRARGDIKITGIGPVVVLSGNTIAEDALITRPCVLPDWYLIPAVPPNNSNRFRGRAQDYLGVDMEITTGKDVKFLYPNSKTPALRATAAENQHVHVTYDYSTKKAKVDGTAAISAGNIYYFQKDFFITEGSLKFDSNSTAINQRKDFNPIINVNATLKDYDKNGNPVEIYLTVTDSYLDDYNPRFSSSAGLTTEEIFSILGNSVLPSDVYGAGSNIVLASVATTAYEMFARLGVMKITMPFNDLTDTLKDALSLDMLSFRSLLVQNFLIDTLNMDRREKISPIARYLNGTSISLGKYISSQFLLQGVIRLNSIDENLNRRKTNVPTFLANDLGIDIELSFGWNNPIAEFTFFTQPTELSAFGFMDNIGLSIKKRLSL